MGYHSRYCAGIFSFLLFFLFILPFTLWAQTGPGGVGNADGSDGEPRLVLWLIPDSLNLTDNDDVLTWTDYSGNGHDLSAQNSTSPIFRADALNGHDYLEFSKNNNRIVSNPFDMPREAVSVFMVFRTGSDGEDALISYNGPSAENNYLLYNPPSLRTIIQGTNHNSGESINTGNWNILSHQWRSVDGDMRFSLDGNELYELNNFETGVQLVEDGSLAIGGEQDGVDAGYTESQDLDGDIAELIIFGSSIKGAQHTVIENYLAQKYGLDANLTTDLYIPQDPAYVVSLTGMGRESDGVTEASADGMVINQNGGFDNGEYIMFGHDGTSNSVNNSPSVIHTDIQAVWERDWYVDKTGDVNAKIAFDMSEGIDGDFPANIQNYRLMYRGNTGDSYDTLEVAGKGVQNGDQIYFSVDNAQLTDGYYTLGTVDQIASPLEGVEGRTWYTLISGDWDNPEVWTLDPSGALPNNPNGYTPSTSPTSNADKVVILSGKTVTVSSGSKTNSRVTVEGRLDLQSTLGHSFGEIKGNGRILLSSDNFPAGDASHFYTPGQGEGTVKYYGTSFELVRSLVFYNLEIHLNSSTETLTLLNDYTVNGNLTIEQGRFQINNSTNTTNLDIGIHGDLMVSDGGSIRTGAANARHQLNLYGNLTNRGTIEFTNRTSASYGSEASDGIVDANFLNDNEDQKVLCDGPSVFYRIEINKGSDDTYILALEATDPSFFNLYGYAGQSHGSTSQLSDNANALGLIKGTVRIGNQVDIPVLSTGSNYNVSGSARLWVDGGFVAKNDGNSLVPYGKICVSNGTLEAEVSSGITTRENGLIKIDGGIIRTNQIRTSVLGASNVGGYVQSGGTTHILGGSTNTDYYCFTLTYPGNVFNMTGGTLHIHEAHGKGGIFIASDEVNQNVTGGTVIMEISDGNDFPVTSTAPFGNVILRNSSGGSGEHVLSGGTDVGATNENLSAQPLVVLNDLTIEADAFFNHNGNDVVIGRDFSINANAQTQTFDDSGLNDTWNSYNIGYLFDPAKPNTTIFNGSQDGEFYIGYNNSDAFEEFFHNITVNKTSGSSITVVCDTRKSAQYLDDNNNNHWYARLPRVENELRVESGILDQGQSAIRLYGPLTVLQDGECGVWEQGTTHPWAWFMLKDADLEINTEKGAVIGNIKMNPNPQTDIITFTSDVYIKRIGYFHGRINLQSYELKLDYLVDGLSTNNYDISDGNSSQEMFYSSGKASDGGLSLYVPAGTPDNTMFPFPLGLWGKYTPAEIELSNVTDDGYINMRPVDGELQTTNLSGGDLLDYYWRVKYEGFDTEPTVNQLRLNYDNADVVGNESNYAAGKVLDVYPFTRSYEDDPNPEGVNASNNTITFNGVSDTGFTLEEAFYTAGETTRFTGDPEVFYLRQNGDWNNGNTWSYSRGGGAAGDYPKVGDIAIMRRTSSGYSGIVTVRQPEAAAAVIFDDETGYASGCPRIIFDTQNDYASYGSNFQTVDVADTHEGGTLNYNTHGAVIQYNIEDNYSSSSSSLEFDGSDDYIAIQNYHYNSDGLTEFTVEAWIKTNDAGDQVIASFDRNQYWRLEVNGSGAGSGQIGFDIMTDAGQLDFGGSTRIDDGNWHHVAGVFDNGTVSLYIDGNLDNSTTSGNTFGSAGVARYGFIGVGSEANSYDGNKGPTNNFNGNISDVRVWGVARSQAQIQASMNGALSGSETGLDIYYKLDGSGSDNTATDVTSNGNTGDLINFTVPGAWTDIHPWGSSFPNGDFGGFNSYPNALVIYGWDGASANADVTLSASATEYPQMWFEGGNDSRIIRFPDTDVTIHGGVTIPAQSIVVANGESENTITMEQNMNVGHSSLGYGRFLFPGNAANSVILNVKKNINVRGDANSLIGIENAAAGTAVHKVIAQGNITVDGSGGQIQFGDGSAAKSNVELEFQGDANGVFTNNYGSSTPQFYRLIMNKGTDSTTTFTLNSNFTLTGATSGVDVNKAIELQNGSLVLNNSAINVNLTTGDDDFYIPGTAGLEVRQGTANANGGSGILLDGKLQVSGGSVDMSGGDNYIQYSASGDASIRVTGGDLTVGSQIRRGLTSTEGILNYNQSGGTVVVGQDAAPENNRGVLEVLNDGSHFSHTGGDLYIARAQNNPTTASLYLDPQTSEFGEGSFIHFGYTNTPANETMGIYSTIALPNVLVNNDNGSNHTLRQRTVPLTVTNSLEIDAGSTFDAYGLDLILEGDMIVEGSFVPNDNTTFFSGSNNQQITGSPAFYNLTKNTAHTLTLNNDITVENELRLEAGTLADGGNTLHARGHVWMDVTHQWGGTGNGIMLDGDALQNIQAEGTFGKLTLANYQGAYVPTGYTIEIDDALQMEHGVLNIGKNLLVLDEDASIIEANAFGVNNMIETNISFTDAGIQKFFPAISSPTNFTYPIGSAGKYTPLELTLNSKSAGGSIRVKAADERHPTIVDDQEPCNELDDLTNVLQYHWLMDAQGISGFSGEAVMQYYPEDVELTSPYYDLTDYITARLLMGTTQWNKYGPDGFDESNNQLNFSFTNADDHDISGDYTAGVEDQDGTCEGAIPDEVPAYVTTTDGTWTDENIWDTYPETGGTVPSNGPKGAITLIEHTVTVPDNYLISYRTTIDTGGVDNNGELLLNSTFGHRLGVVDGTGLLQIQRGALPAGIYDDFFGPDGGTLEYAGTDNYDVLSEITTLNNLRFSGTGLRRLPNLNLRLYGNLEIAGGDMVNEFNRELRVDSNIVFTGGTLDAGTGPGALLRLEGPLQQEITGDLSGSNAWNHVEINNPNDIIVHNNLGLKSSLTLNAGKILVDAGGKVIVDNASTTAIQGASSQRYVDGVLSKRMNTGSSFSFPVGSEDRYGVLDLTGTNSSGFWDARYYNRNPDVDGYNISNMAPGIVEVSDNEYWSVQGPGEAKVTIRWDDQSILPARTDDRVNDLYIVEYLSNQWNDAGNDVNDGGVNSGTVTSDVTDLTASDHIFTLGSAETEPKATATFITGDTTLCGSGSVDLEIQLEGEANWDLVIHRDGSLYQEINDITTGSVVVTATDAGVYTIESVSDNNGPGNVYGDPVTVSYGYEPAAFDVTGGGDICSNEASTIGLDGSELGVTYELFTGSTLLQTISGDGGAIEFGDYSAEETYRVEAVRSDGCRTPMNNTVTINVYEVPDPEPNADQNPACYSTGISIGLHANDGAGTYNYSWTPLDDLINAGSEEASYQPGSNPNAVADTTWFYIEADNNGCVGVDSLQMILYRRPETGKVYHVPNNFDQN